MNRLAEIIEIEKFYNIKLMLLIEDERESSSSVFYKNENTYNLNLKNEVVKLNLKDNSISDLSVLGKLKNSLTHLNLATNKINNVELLKDFNELIFLDLSTNQIADIKPLSNLKKLEQLYLDNNDISELPLFDLPKLNELWLYSNLLSELNNLKSITSLLSLNLSYNKIVELSPIKSLKKLEKLIVIKNQITDVSILKQLKNLDHIDFSGNRISDISSLKDLKNLKNIIFTENLVFDLSPLISLIRENENLNYNFYENQLIYPSNEVYLKGDRLLIEWFDNVHIYPNELIKKCISNSERRLDLGNCGITDLTLLDNFFDCTHIEELILSNEWAEYNGEDWVKRFSNNSTKLRNNLFEIPKAFSKFQNLKKIIIGGDWNYEKEVKRWRIKNIDNLKTLKKIEFLNASNNEIRSVSILNKFDYLDQLHLNNNKITSVNLVQENNLLALNLSNNDISNLSFLRELKSIKIIDLHSNKIKNIDDFQYIIDYVDKIVIDNNPIVSSQNWKLSKYKDHSTIIRNYLSSKSNNSVKLKELILPVKVLFLGNHGSGKSTLLDYLIDTNKQKKVKEKNTSTHILRIEKFPKKLTRGVLPDIIYFDFGGQDYYHGIYNAFLTNGAINILLWNENTNENIIRKDLVNDLWTRDFTKEYWLYQLRYFYKGIRKNSKYGYLPEINERKSKKDIIFLIQSYADDIHSNRLSLVEEINNINVLNEFYLSLNQKEIDRNEIHKINLKYFEDVLNYEIREKKRTNDYKIKKPLWYHNFLLFILNNNDVKPLKLYEVRKKYVRNINGNETEIDIVNFLKDDLDQLHKQGLILYYKDEAEINDVVWLNPELLIKHVHSNILSDQILKKENGIIKEEIFLDLIENEVELKTLLLLQKVIFFDKYYKRYIIPSFLPLSNDEKEKNKYDILTFGLDTPDFILKFEKFIPFGIINQLICNFGNNSESKFFWRDQLIFTFERNTKILIKLDFNNLEIAVHFNFVDNEKRKNDVIKKYIFNCLIAIYYDINVIDFKKFKIHYEDEKIDKNPEVVNFIECINDLPDDLYISLDEKWYVKGEDIDNQINRLKILSYFNDSIGNLKEDGSMLIYKKLDRSSYRELELNIFKNFTNKKLNKIKKIFISYAKENKKEVNEFQRQIAPFKLTREVETWHCSELELGEDWENKIKTKLYDADIILYFISAFFFSTPYILDEEVRRGIERHNDPNDNVILIPIILEKIHWNDLLGKYTSNFKGKPINLYDKSTNAWYEVVDDIKNQYLRKSDVENTANIIGQSKEKMKSQEEIINGKF